MSENSEAVGAPVEPSVRRAAFWRGFWDGMGMGPLWRWLACRAGLHRWWHLQVWRDDGMVDVCCNCGRTRPAQD